MLKAGPAKKLIIHVGEDHSYHGQSAYSAILDFLFANGVAGANAVRGIAGFGASHHMHTARILDLTGDLPVRVEFIETEQKIEELLPKLREMAGTGLIEIQDTTVLKPAEPTAKKPSSPEKGSEKG